MTSAHEGMRPRKPAGGRRLAMLLALMALAAHAHAAAGAPVALRRLLPGETLRNPVHLAQVPDGSGDLVVVEQGGVIKRFAPGGRRTAGALLDIRTRVSTRGWEEGLLSIAFHPNYAANRTFFVYYSAARPRRSVIARFRADRSGGQADPASERVLMEVAQPYANHNGGQLAFGPDGMLYVALGDGGSGGDPQGNGQNRRTLLGTILRIDVDRRGAGKAYAIPPDNPFARSGEGSRAEIWAYGLRNPWRFSFDRGTGDLFAADVGQGAIEEVNRITKGGNYGWNVMEGSRCYHPSFGCDRGGLELPITEYTHRHGRSITGGFVYRGKTISRLQGRYVFADYVSGTIWSVPAHASGFSRPRTELSTDLAISSFGEDAAGELYVLDHRGGRVFRLVAAR